MQFLLGFFLWAQSYEASPFRPLEEFIPPPTENRNRLGLPTSTYWQNQADYKMQIRLQPDTKTLVGTLLLTYTNYSPHTLCQLWFQLDQNYFQIHSLNHLSKDFATENFERDLMRKDASLADLHYRQIKNYLQGGFQIEKVRLADGVDLRYRIDDTMMEVELPTCLSPQKSIQIQITWRYNINDGTVEGRSGYMEVDKKRLIFTLAQFYPRVCAYTDLRGWQHTAYYGSSEFALEFGDYEVFIEVPQGYIVAATGMLQNPQTVLTPSQKSAYEKANDQTYTYIVSPKDLPLKTTETYQTWHFKAERVRDFAFAASSVWIWQVRQTRIQNRPVWVHAYYTQEVAPLWDKLAIGAAEYTLHAYGSFTFPYPYPQISVVYGAIYGMEYPMIVFCGRQQVDKKGTYSLAARQGFIGLVIHEVGHNFFPMVVNSDERRWMWLDEGINTYVENLSKTHFEPGLRHKEAQLELQRVRNYMASAKSQSIMLMPHMIREMGANAYLKVAVGLQLLREYILKPEVMDTAFARYARAWAFKRPEPFDLFRVISQSTTQNLDWFWWGWFYQTWDLDLGIDTVVCKEIKLKGDLEAQVLLAEEKAAYEKMVSLCDQRRRKPTYFVESRPELQDAYVKEAFKWQDSILQVEEATYQQALQSKEKFLSLYQNPPKKLWENFIVFKNYQLLPWGGRVTGLVFPIRARITYTDGSSSLWEWPAETWMKNPQQVLKVFYTAQPIKKVEIDPWNQTPDTNPDNNIYTLPDAKP
ncbi:MAG: M1 family metallopeptidase [Bacteroidia bacterium]